MKKLNEQDFIKMANKIYIKPTQEVLEYLKQEYEEIDNALDQLEKIDTTNIKPISRVSKNITYLREDEIDESIYLDKKTVLDNSKEKNDDYIIIKRILK